MLVAEIGRRYKHMSPDRRQRFSDLFVFMRVTLHYNESISDFEMARIEERLKMFDDLWKESLRVQKERAEYYEKGFKHGLAEVISQRIAKKIAQEIEQVMTEEIAKGVTQGIEGGIEQGEIQHAQRTLVMFLQTKFPDLAGLAGKYALNCRNLDVLENTTQQLFTAPDSKAARELVESISEQRE
jgi:hypothetical protein